ncbi:hypothetical protein GQ54DRAFT_56624 [Martensiomyces pterosporus]|nr:hypothetical protein GQ54DRAFT_56624 [Martensiomyces pterosporus]
MTAASTHRHKRRVAPGSGQNKRRRAAQNAQSQNTGSGSSSGGGPNDLECTTSQPDTSQQEGSTSTGRRMVTRSMTRRAVNQPEEQERSDTREAPESAGAEQALSQESTDGRPVVVIVRPHRDSDAVDSTDTAGSAQPGATPVPMDVDGANTTASALKPNTAHRSCKYTQGLTPSHDMTEIHECTGTP